MFQRFQLHTYSQIFVSAVAAVILLTVPETIAAQTNNQLEPLHQQKNPYYSNYDLSAPPDFQEQGLPSQQNTKIDLDSATSGDWRYKTSRGFFVGNDFAIEQHGRAAMQVDTVAGYSRSLGAHTGLQVGYNHSVFPNEGRLNRNEVFANLSHKNLSFEVSQGLRTGVNKNNKAYHLDYVLPLNTRWSVGLGMDYERFNTASPKSTLDYRADVLYRLKSLRSMSIYFGSSTQKSPADTGNKDSKFMFGANVDF